MGQPNLTDNQYYRDQVLQTEGIASRLGTGTTSAGAVTINDLMGTITTEALTTAQNAIETITLTNSKIAAADIVFVTIANGTNTQGTPMLGTVVPAAGSCVIKVINKHATAEAFNGTLKVHYMVVRSAT